MIFNVRENYWGWKKNRPASERERRQEYVETLIQIHHVMEEINGGRLKTERIDWTNFELGDAL